MVGSVTERVLAKGPCTGAPAVHKPSPDFLSSREQQDPVHLNRILFVGFLREFGAGLWASCDFSDGGVQRRPHPAARIGGYPKLVQHRRGNVGGNGATGRTVPSESRKVARSRPWCAEEAVPADHPACLGSAKRPSDYGSARPWRLNLAVFGFNHL